MLWGLWVLFGVWFYDCVGNLLIGRVGCCNENGWRLSFGYFCLESVVGCVGDYFEVWLVLVEVFGNDFVEGLFCWYVIEY